MKKKTAAGNLPKINEFSTYGLSNEAEELSVPELRFLHALLLHGNDANLTDIVRKAKSPRESMFVALMRLKLHPKRLNLQGNPLFIIVNDNDTVDIKGKTIHETTTYDITVKGKKAVAGWKPPAKAPAPFSKKSKELGVKVTHYSQLEADGTPRAEFIKRNAQEATNK